MNVEEFLSELERITDKANPHRWQETSAFCAQHLRSTKNALNPEQAARGAIALMRLDMGREAAELTRAAGAGSETIMALQEMPRESRPNRHEIVTWLSAWYGNYVVALPAWMTAQVVEFILTLSTDRNERLNDLGSVLHFRRFLSPAALRFIYNGEPVPEWTRSDHEHLRQTFEYAESIYKDLTNA